MCVGVVGLPRVLLHPAVTAQGEVGVERPMGGWQFPVGWCGQRECPIDCSGTVSVVSYAVFSEPGERLHLVPYVL